MVSVKTVLMVDVVTLLLFFFNDTATTEIYTLSLHDALPISLAPGQRPAIGRRPARPRPRSGRPRQRPVRPRKAQATRRDRKSTRLNSSHANISYAVFCLKKKKPHNLRTPDTPTPPCSLTQ